MSRRHELWIRCAIAFVFVVLCVAPFAGANTGVSLDSFHYQAASRLSVFSGDFVAGSRSFGYPLYLMITGRNDTAAVVGQLLLSIGAWLALAVMAASATRHQALRIAAFTIVLILGASFETIQWQRVIVSESLSITCSVGLLAALLWLRERFTVPRVAIVGLLGFAATALRDSNGTMLGFIAVLLVLAVAFRALPRRTLAVAGAFLVAALIGTLSANGGNRWEIPLKNVITVRVLESPERLRDFQDAGLPMTAAEIEAARGRCVSQPPTACVINENDAFYEWIRTDGRSTYVKSLIKHPATTVWEPVAHLRDSIGTRVRVEHPLAVATEERSPPGHFFEAVFFVRNPLAVALAALAVLGACIVAFAKGKRGVFVGAAALIALTYPHLWLVWVGDAQEVTRHLLVASVTLRIAIWLGAIWLLDAVLTEPEPEPGLVSIQDPDPVPDSVPAG